MGKVHVQEPREVSLGLVDRSPFSIAGLVAANARSKKIFSKSSRFAKSLPFYLFKSFLTILVLSFHGINNIEKFILTTMNGL